MMKAYTGIGSRTTPLEIQVTMTNIASWLEAKGYTLRSGGAKGADSAFEKCIKINKEIYYASDANELSMTIAAKYHPAWDKVGEYAKKLHARNAFQILGASLNDPVDFVICWTSCGCESHSTRTMATGGTGTAISIASMNGIRVYNLKNDKSINELRELLKTIK